MHGASRKLLTGSALRTLALIVNGAVAFLILPFLVRHIGDRLYGLWALVGTFVGYYGLLDLGLTSSVCQYISTALGREDWSECNITFNTSLRIHSFMGITVLILSLACSRLIPVFSHLPGDASLFSAVIIVLGISMALSFPTKTYIGLLYADLSYDLVSWISLATVGIRTVAIIWSVRAGYGLFGLAASTAAAGLLNSVATVVVAHRRFSWLRIKTAYLKRSTAKSLLSYSIYLAIVDFADRLRFELDPVVISVFIGLGAVTHYRIASVLTDQYMRVMISAIAVFQPLFSRLHSAGEEARVQENLLLATKISVCMASFLCFGLIAWGRPLILRWMGSSYQDAYPPLVVLALALLMDLWQVPAGNFLNAIFRHRSFAVLTISEGLLNLAVSLALVRQYGILGVALGTLIAAFVIRIIAQPWWMCKVGNVPYVKYILHILGSVAVSACAIGVCYVLVARWLRPSYCYMACSGAIAILIYAFGAWQFILSPGERTIFRVALTKRSQQLFTFS